MLKHTIDRADFKDKSLGQKGFTLIELLVVILILGILAAVVVIAVGNLTQRAQENACDTEAKQIRTAVEAYRADVGPAAATPSLAQLVSNDLLQETPTDHSLSYTSGKPVITDTGDCA